MSEAFFITTQQDLQPLVVPRNRSFGDVKTPGLLEVDSSGGFGEVQFSSVKAQYNTGSR